MADSERNEIIFTGFDSAWGERNSGAICDLVLKEDGALQLDRDPVVANWDQAIAQASQTRVADLHVWAIDQPICVRNETGCRPVEQDLARALMAGFGCGAHSSNLGTPCWQLGARIWEFIRALEANNYVHNPMAIPTAKNGRHYFECYPHPALLGVFDLDKIVNTRSVTRTHANGAGSLICIGRGYQRVAGPEHLRFCARGPRTKQGQ